MTTERAPAVIREVEVGGRALTLCYMTAAHAPAMLKFARALPAHDLLFLRRDITQPDEVDAWVAEIEEGHMGTILAVDGEGAILGYAAVSRETLRWTHHIAELRVLVAESMRGKGLGRVLTTAAFRVAHDLGVRKMIARMTIDQQGAIGVFRRLGFHSAALLPDYVIDQDGRTYDLVMMHQDVSEFPHTLESL